MRISLRKPNYVILFIVILILIGIFFYKTVFKGLIPFPGDLLLSGYSPWRHESYNGYVAGAIPSKDQYFDVIRELYPWKTQVIQEIKQGSIPLWNPYNFSGSPLLANYQSQVFYPLSLLYYIFPQVTAWTILILLQPLLGSVFLYLFATEIGLSMTGALTAAILFNFSSFASVWIEFNTVWHTILWLPLLLYLIERGVKQKKFVLWQQILFMFGLFSAITAGHPQDFLNSFFFLVIYITVRVLTLTTWSRKEKIMFIIRHLSYIILIPFLLAAPQLLPTIELFKNSARVTHDYQQILSNMLVQWWQLPLLVIQDFFGNPATKTNITGDYVGKTLSIGVTGFILAMVGIWRSPPSFHKKFLIITTFVVLLITLNSPLTQLLYRYPIPIMSTGTPARILFLLSFSFALLAGFGIDAIKTQKKSLLPFVVFFIGLLALFWLFALFHPLTPGLIYSAQSFASMKRVMLLSSAIGFIIIMILFLRKYTPLTTYGFIIVLVAELSYSFIKFNPFVPSSFVFPENVVMQFMKNNAGIYRYWGYGTAAVEANFATQTQTYSTDGTDPLNLRWYNEFIQSSKKGTIAKTFNRTTRSDAQIAPGYGANDLPSNTFRLKIMDLLGVKYVINRSENPMSDKTFPIDRFKPVWQKDTWTIFENLKAAPRFFLTTDVVGYTNDIDFEKLFFNENSDYRTVYLQNNDITRIPKFTGVKHSITLMSYTPNKIVFSTDTDGKQLLFLSDTYDTGWTALIDGNTTDVLKADWAFRALVVPGGLHTVVFMYYPRSFRIGIYVCALGLFFLITGLLIQLLSLSKQRTR